MLILASIVLVVAFSVLIWDIGDNYKQKYHARKCTNHGILKHVVMPQHAIGRRIK